MRSFFDAMAPWPQQEGSLHLYVLPDDAARERLRTAQEALAGIAHLPLMPPAYLHFTVQRLTQFDDLPQAELSRVAGHLTTRIDELGRFALHLGAPARHETAIEITAAPSGEWDALVAAVRRGLVDAFPGDDLLPPPHAPHLSLAYATGPASDDAVERALEQVSPIGEVIVDGVQLVSVTVRPELGIFDFTELAGWELG
ncbi:MAG TPA: hypothetical protein PKE40_14060 [Arachnia sp.]|nr:hypothetical protein [Arachnia sp.]HMT87468.1 hypothetical protein [Arachnia sp.]